MNREESWQVIEQQRRAIADLMDEVTAARWDLPSLCEGWRIRDVAAHVALAAHPPGAGSMIVDTVRAGGRFHRLNHDTAVRHADRLGAGLSTELRAYAASRKLPIVTNYRNILPDTMVHGQDIAIPLGRTLPIPTSAAAAAATRIWTMGWPFWAQRRLRGFRLIATDTDWTAGLGAEVHGPIAALLLLLTGRPAALPHLSGDTLPTLTAGSKAKKPVR